MSRIAIHTITNKPWNLAQCAKNYAAAKIGGVTLWRHHFATNSPAEAGRILCDAGLVCTGLARAGFFPAQIPADRKTGIEDTRRAIDEAAGCGAPILVLVCGAVPGIPLTEARRQICDGIASCLPDARAAGVKLAIEPLHPMYAADRSAIVTTEQANDICDFLGSPRELGIALDVYHTWWDSGLEREIVRAGRHQRLFSFHICDWISPTTDLLNDRVLMGEGCIPIRQIADWVDAAGFMGPYEVEIFSNRWWAADQDDYLQKIVQSCVALGV